LLERLAPQAAERRREVLDESAALVQRALTDVRTISYLLHPPLLDEAGLASAMRWYVEGFARRSGIHVELELPDEILRLAEDRETALFRVVQESLINIHRHADSPVAHVRLRHHADTVILEIEDEGRGIPVADNAMAQSSLGVGIAGMRERMEQLGGRLELASTDRGTTVRAILPRGEVPS
jgi:signal transduction histidine kinase